MLRGRADRIELDDDGQLFVVDLKTGKYPPTDKTLGPDPQLGVYQLAVREGAFADRVVDTRRRRAAAAAQGARGKVQGAAAAGARAGRPLGR